MIAETHFAGRQCLGKRALQEDAYAFSEVSLGTPETKGLLLVVADGMGGHAGGGQASDLAVRKFVAAFHRGNQGLAERFGEALEVANAAIADAIEGNPDELEGMGTTLVAAALSPAGLEWISVGDSPLYLWRGGELRRLNADHSYRPILREMIERGELTAEQAATSSLRNRLRAALIGAEIAMTDASRETLPLLPGDVVIAASDGLQTLDDSAISGALAAAGEDDAAGIARRLLKQVLAAEKPKQDNATVGIVRVPGEEQAAGSTSTESSEDGPTRRRAPEPQASATP